MDDLCMLIEKTSQSGEMLMAKKAGCLMRVFVTISG